MKRTLALIFTLLLAFAFAIPASAEGEAATLELNWENVEPYLEVLGMEGDFYVYEEIGMQLWIPSGFEQVELDEDDIANGTIDLFLTEDDTSAIRLQYFESLNWDDEKLISVLENVGASNITPVVLNGLYGYTYDLKETDTGALDFLIEGGDILEIAFGPVSDDANAALFLILTASIQPLSKESAEPAA